MKHTPLFAAALLTLGLAFAVAGCSTAPRAVAASNRAPVYALVVSVNGGQPPTDAQWAVLTKKFAAMLSARGITLITDPTFADKLIHVQFYPDADDPEAGSVYVVGVRNNPAASIAVATRTSSASYGYSSYSSYGGYGYNSYYPSDYYGYFSDYGSSYTGNVSPTRPHHTGDHHTTKPIDCIPDRASHPPAGYAGNHPSHPNPPAHWWSPRPSSDSGSSSYSSSSYSSRTYDSPSSSSSSSYSAPSISMSSSSSSYSSSTYSSPSPSYSSSDSSSSAPSISMSSSSSSTSSSSGPSQEQPR